MIEKVLVNILNLDESVSKTFEIQVQVLIPSRGIVVHLVVGLVAARKGRTAGFIKRRHKFVAIQSLVAVRNIVAARICIAADGIPVAAHILIAALRSRRRSLAIVMSEYEYYRARDQARSRAVQST